MPIGVKYKVADIYDCLMNLYTITQDSYKGGMGKLGSMTELVARECRKRGIVSYNENRKDPEWKWMASMSPTKELAKNILKALEENYRAYSARRAGVTDEMRVAINSLPNIPQSEFQSEHQDISNSPTYEGTVVSRVHLSPELIEKLGDKFLVAILRQRGYTVTCTKTVEL